MNSRRALVVLLFCSVGAGFSQTGENVLVVVNQSSTISRHIGEYYIHKRDVPLENLCRIKTTPDEEISYDVYETQIERPIGRYLRSHRLAEKILYIVTTVGVPLKIHGLGEGMSTESSSVDSELTLLLWQVARRAISQARPRAESFFRTDWRALPARTISNLPGHEISRLRFCGREGPD